MRAIIAVTFSILLLGSLGWSIPRYSADYNQSCGLCHVDPSGGGARSLYGAQFFAYTELAMQETGFEDIGRVQPMLNDQVQIGLDARTQFFGSDEPGTNTFMQMQGDLYLVFQLSPQWTLYLDKGLYSGFEIWGMGHVLPYNGYIKVGRFTPPYGLRTADHKVFVREKWGFQYGWQESGMEIGFHPQKFSLAAAVTNGSAQFVDADEAKAVTARADLRVPVGDALLWIGATGRYNQVEKEDDLLGGGYGGLSFWKFTLLGEIDYRDYLGTNSIASFAQLAFHPWRGVTLKAEYDFYDPDIDYETGAERMVVFGTDIVPLGFLELIPNVRYHDFDAESDEDYYEGEVQLHIFF